MTILTLARPQQIVIPPNLVELAERTKKIGYDLLHSRVANLVGFNSGVAALMEKGIPVYNQKSVERYKSFQVKWSRVKLWGAFAGSCILTLALLFVIAFALFWPKNEWFIAGRWCAGIAALVLGGLGSIALGIRASDTTFRWNRVGLAVYDKPIPFSALETALKVKEHFPMANLHIDELTAESRRARVADPFLVVRLGDREYYIAVWNEPSFGKKMYKNA